MKSIKVSDDTHKYLKIFVAEFGGGLTVTAFADKAITDSLRLSGQKVPLKPKLKTSNTKPK